MLRGGYGVFYERIEGNFLFSAINNPPFIAQSDITDGNIENPTGGTRRLSGGTFELALPGHEGPRVMNWSLGIQHKIDNATTLDVAYVGSSAANLSRNTQPQPISGGDAASEPRRQRQRSPAVSRVRQYQHVCDRLQHDLQLAAVAR